MATPTTYAAAKSFIGVSKEVTQGTVVPPLTATIPVNKFTPEDKFEQLKDKAQRGSMAGTYDQQQGAGHVEFTIEESPAFFDTLPYALYNILGDIATTGAGPRTHEISLLNSGTAQPGTFTIFDWQGTPANRGRQYPGCVLTELTIKGNPQNEYVTWSAKGVAWPSAATAAEPVANASTDRAIPAWRAIIRINDVQVSVIGEWEITITREADPEHTSQGTQDPYIIQRGALTVTGSVRVRKPSDETEYNYFLNGTHVELEIVADNGLATTSQRSISLHMEEIAFDTGALTRDELAIGYQLPFEAMANAVDAGASGGESPIMATVINNTAAGTYS